jgi:hypothetical protein
MRILAGLDIFGGPDNAKEMKRAPRPGSLVFSRQFTREGAKYVVVGQVPGATAAIVLARRISGEASKQLGVFLDASELIVVSRSKRSRRKRIGDLDHTTLKEEATVFDIMES